MQTPPDRRGDVGPLRAADRRDALQESEHALQGLQRTTAFRTVLDVTLDAGPRACNQLTVEIGGQLAGGEPMIAPEPDLVPEGRHEGFDLRAGKRVRGHGPVGS